MKYSNIWFSYMMKFLGRTLVFWPVLYEPSIYWPLDYLFVHYRLWVNRAYEHNNELLQSLYKYNLFLCLFYCWQNTANLFDTSIHLFLLFLFLTIVFRTLSRRASHAGNLGQIYNKRDHFDQQQGEQWMMVSNHGFTCDLAKPLSTLSVENKN